MSLVAPWLPGARVLDLFAGSGALGIEAVSRGAAEATLVEIGAASLAAIRENLRALGDPPGLRVRRADAARLVARLAPGEYDLVFADPPWRHDHAAALVSRFLEAPFATLLVVEHAAAADLPGGDTRRYGDTALTLCRAP